MSYDNNWMLLTTLTSVLTLFAIFCLVPIAKKIGLVDKPGGRKKHLGEIPLIGGISIYLVLGTFAVFTGYFNNDWKWVLGVASILIIIGLIDDIWDIRPAYKLIAQIVVSILLMISTGDFIKIIAYLPSGNTINIGELGYLITPLAVVGLINAFNMFDGIDGLAAIQAVLSIVLIFTSMLILNTTFSKDIFIIFLLGALLGFLISNLNLLPITKVFLGDAGSMMLGFLIAWMLITYTQTPNKQGLPPSLSLWVVAIPVADTLAVSLRRLLLRNSPFRPDRKHLHHICLKLGLTPLHSLGLIFMLSIISYLIGITTYFLFGDIASIVIFFVMLILYYKIIKNIWWISNVLRKFNANR